METFYSKEDLEKISLEATAVGSLPHTSPEKAVKLICDNFPSFPFWPQLANINPLEDMIIQYSENFPGLTLDIQNQNFKFESDTEEFYNKLEELYLDYDAIVIENDMDRLDKYAIKAPYSTSIKLFLEKTKEIRPKFAKGQITGPFTWGTSVCDNEKKCLFYEDTYRDIVLKILTLKALWQIKAIKSASPETIPVIFMDEPTLAQIGTSAFLTVPKNTIIQNLQEISSIINRNGALCGVHCCGKADWKTILESGINILSFDAFAFIKNLAIFSNEINSFIKNHGIIAWGIVPTLDVEALKKCDSNTLVKKLEDGFNMLEKKGLDKTLILKHSIITPSCGAGSLDEELAEKAMTLTSEISHYFKIKYKGI